MNIIKWYSIIWLSFCTIATLWLCIRERSLPKFIAFLTGIPTIVYLIIKQVKYAY